MPKSKDYELELFSNLPAPLLEKGVVLAGEYAWNADDTVQVIEWLASVERPVVGVELWQNQEGMPKWIATSDYNNDQWLASHDYVNLCSRDAISFIRRFENHPGALFNLS